MTSMLPNHKLDELVLEKFVDRRRATIRGNGFPVDRTTFPNRALQIGELSLGQKFPKLQALDSDIGFNHLDILRELRTRGYPFSETRGRETFDFYFNLFFDPSVTAYVDSRGKNELVKFALECALAPEMMSTLQLRLGLGVQDGCEHAVRLPSYIFPIVQFLKKLIAQYGAEGINVAQGVLPKIKIYSAAAFVTQVNKLDATKATANRDQYFQVLKSFISKELPLAGQEAFEFISDDAQKIDELRGDIEERSMNLLSTKPDHPVVKKIISTALRNGSTPIDGVAYAVSHAVYSLDPVQDSLRRSFMPGETEWPERVIMMGGESEIDYWRVRQLVAEPDPRMSRVQIITRFGAVPPYTGVKPGDFSTSSLREKAPEESLDDIEGVSPPFLAELRSIAGHQPRPMEYLQSIWF